MLKAFKNALDELVDLPLERVQAIYTGLFINGFPHTPCPPYESVYRDGGELLGVWDTVVPDGADYRSKVYVVHDPALPPRSGNSKDRTRLLQCCALTCMNLDLRKLCA